MNASLLPSLGVLVAGVVVLLYGWAVYPQTVFGFPASIYVISGAILIGLGIRASGRVSSDQGPVDEPSTPPDGD